ncbi:MAG TPA: hypothetical protein VHU42_12290 [Rhodopila sp.]|nr:hypothetical protein [Rhodopila sp.]
MHQASGRGGVATVVPPAVAAVDTVAPFTESAAAGSFGSEEEPSPSGAAYPHGRDVAPADAGPAVGGGKNRRAPATRPGDRVALEGVQRKMWLIDNAIRINVRSSTIIGFVGAGGIGQELKRVIGFNIYEEVYGCG